MAKAPEDFDITTKRDKEMRKKKMMNKKHYIKSLVMLATMLLVACGSGSDGFDDEPQNVADNASPQEIRLNANVWHMMEGTRATTYDSDDDLQSGTFKTYVYVDGETNQYISGSTVSYVTDHWEFDDGKHYWPLSGALNFFCYMPYDLANTCCTIDPTAYADPGNLDGYSEDTPRFTCTDLPVTITRGSDNTNELILAYAAQQDRAGTNSTLQPTAGEVALSFKHPFARVCFKLSAESGTHVVINSITIPAIYRDGFCTFNGAASPQTFTWSSLADNDEGLVISPPSAGSQATDDDAFYLVIPNNYGTKTFTVNATWDDWSVVTKNVSADVTVNWQAGYSYTYTFTLSKYALKVDVAKYTEQW